MPPPRTKQNPHTSVGGSIPSRATSSHEEESRDTPGQTTPEPWGFALWQHLHQEHGLTLVESELQEIVRLARPLIVVDEDKTWIRNAFPDLQKDETDFQTQVNEWWDKVKPSAQEGENPFKGLLKKTKTKGAPCA